MASEVDIANLALSHIGEDATVASLSPPDGSAQAEHCARFYPIARDTCMQAHSWKFAKRTTQLNEPLIYAVDGWGFAYALPSDLLKTLRLYPEGARRDIDHIYEFDSEIDDNGQVILLTDVENPFIIYTQRISDTSKFPPAFVTALSYLLASMIAGPVLKGDSGQAAGKYWIQMWQAFVSVASVLDSMNQKTTLDPVPSNIQARL